VPPVEQLELLCLRHGVSSDDHLLKKLRRPAFRTVETDEPPLSSG
jgi:hypothetical protein